MLAHASVTNALRVLLVEDSRVLTERIAEAIAQISDVELVAMVDSEPAALTAVRGSNVDVLILDLHLKQGTGFGVMRALAQIPGKPCVVILTNYDLPEYKSAAMALGARYFLDKARDYDRLPDVLKEIADNKRTILNS
jgi:two-component system, OmpR family, response regulator